MQQTINNKILSAIGFSFRSKSVVVGLENVKSTRKKMHIIIVCSTVTDKNLSQLTLIAEEKNIALIKLDSGLLLSQLTNKESLKVLGLTNFQLSKLIIENNDNHEFEIIKRGNLIEK